MAGRDKQVQTKDASATIIRSHKDTQKAQTKTEIMILRTQKCDSQHVVKDILNFLKTCHNDLCFVLLEMSTIVSVSQQTPLTLEIKRYI